MLHKGLFKIWAIVSISVILCGSVVSNLHSQTTIGLSMSSTFVPDKFLFKDEALSRSPRIFTGFGINLTHKDITTSIVYSFNIRTFTLSSHIPIIKLGKRKKLNW